MKSKLIWTLPVLLLAVAVLVFGIPGGVFADETTFDLSEKGNLEIKSSDTATYVVTGATHASITVKGGKHTIILRNADFDSLSVTGGADVTLVIESSSVKNIYSEYGSSVSPDGSALASESHGTFIQGYLIAFDPGAGTKLKGAKEAFIANASTNSGEDKKITLDDVSQYQKSGYTCLGFSLNKDGSGKTYTEISESELETLAGAAHKVTFYPSFEADEYKIEYNTLGEPNDTRNPGTYSVDKEPVHIYDLQNKTEKADGTVSERPYFAGWYSDELKITEDKPERDLNIPKDTVGNIKLIASWSAIRPAGNTIPVVETDPAENTTHVVDPTPAEGSESSSQPAGSETTGTVKDRSTVSTGTSTDPSAADESGTSADQKNPGTVQKPDSQQTPATADTAGQGFSGNAENKITSDVKGLQPTLGDYSITYYLPVGAQFDMESLSNKGRESRTRYSKGANFGIAYPSLEGYKFTGWDGTGLTLPTKNVSITETMTGNRVYYAVFQSETDPKVYLGGRTGQIVDSSKDQTPVPAPASPSPSPVPTKAPATASPTATPQAVVSGTVKVDVNDIDHESTVNNILGARVDSILNSASTLLKSDDPLALSIKAVNDAGRDVVLKLAYTENVSNVSDAGKIQVYADTKGYDVVAFFDLTISAYDGSNLLGTITTTVDPIGFTLILPDEYLGGDYDFKVVRVHDGVLKGLSTHTDGSDVFFSSDRFSTYALLYKDNGASETSVGKSGNQANSDGGSSGNGTAGAAEGTSGGLVKTGDNMPFIPFLILFLVGLSGAAAVTIVKIRHGMAG
ncbi:MAG: hypothetical protein VZR00_06385 [Lachnospiraceae bacterium]|jgi:uncharacterized repeat protein (TIGR02543 family)|nr:hypothetical protein [Lachnospiraceae bacterium]MEE3461504.1 hypothetical protein [Lachnospiraceae bacterium]